MESRNKWGSRRTNPDHDGTPKRTMVIHHSAFFGMAIDTVSEQRAAMRAMQAFHIDTRGWDDIGYLGAVFQPQGRLRGAKAYVARSFNDHATSLRGRLPVPAAQGGANSGTVPVVVVGNFQAERVKRRTVRKLVKIAKGLKRHHGITHVAGHGPHFGGTSCPGSHLIPLIDDVARAAGLKVGRG